MTFSRKATSIYLAARFRVNVVHVTCIQIWSMFLDSITFARSQFQCSSAKLCWSNYWPNIFCRLRTICQIPVQLRATSPWRISSRWGSRFACANLQLEHSYTRIYLMMYVHTVFIILYVMFCVCICTYTVYWNGNSSQRSSYLYFRLSDTHGSFCLRVIRARSTNWFWVIKHTGGWVFVSNNSYWCVSLII